MTDQSETPAYSMGLMSGTSADGIDGAVIKIHEGKFTLVATESLSYPEILRQSVLDVCAQKIMDRSEAKNIENQLSGLFADISLQMIDKVSSISVCVIGCHGQTVHHSPETKPPFSIQLADGTTIAQRTGIPVVTDFRAHDIAAGGQGAPLAPGFHLAAFQSSKERRAVVNIGGIANITVLPKDRHDQVVGYDIGPGNTLMDNWCLRHFSSPFDRDGLIAESGTPQPDLLEILLDEDYFAKPPPKSTGLELFNLDWLDSKLTRWRNDNQCVNRDVLSTLSMLTARIISATINHSRPEIDSVFICGGGAKNIGLVKQIQRRCQAPVFDTSALGIGPQWVEAAAFAWMAYQTAKGLPSTLPSVTGATRPCIAGTINNPQ